MFLEEEWHCRWLGCDVCVVMASGEQMGCEVRLMFDLWFTEWGHGSVTFVLERSLGGGTVAD